MFKLWKIGREQKNKKKNKKHPNTQKEEFKKKK